MLKASGEYLVDLTKQLDTVSQVTAASKKGLSSLVTKAKSRTHYSAKHPNFKSESDDQAE